MDRFLIQKGETAMKRRKNTRIPGRKWLAVLLAAVLLLASCALAEDGLEGYSKEKAIPTCGWDAIRRLPKAAWNRSCGGC